MFRRFFNVTRHMAAGLLLLLAVAAAAELTLQRTNRPAVGTVTPTTCDTVQSLLQQSKTTHHELAPSPVASACVRATCIADDFRVNSFGCRGEEVHETAEQGTYRILILGDDSVCNPWIPEAETLPARLRQFMQPRTSAQLQIINGAVPGDCPLLAWLRFRHRLAALRPDLVILHFDMSDIADDRRYRRQLDTTVSPPVCPHASFAAPVGRTEVMLSTVRQSAIASRILDASQNWARQAISRERSESQDKPFAWIEDRPCDGRIQIAHALEPIAALRDDVERHGGRFLLTTAPVLWQVTRADMAPALSQHCAVRGVTPYQSDLPFRVVETFCELKQVRCLPVVDVFAEADAPETYFSQHQPVLSRSGIALYAREIGAYLTSHPPVRWSAHGSPERN